MCCYVSDLNNQAVLVSFPRVLIVLFILLTKHKDPLFQIFYQHLIKYPLSRQLSLLHNNARIRRLSPLRSVSIPREQCFVLVTRPVLVTILCDLFACEMALFMLTYKINQRDECLILICKRDMLSTQGLTKRELWLLLPCFYLPQSVSSHAILGII